MEEKDNVIQFKPHIDKKFMLARVEAYKKVVHSMDKLDLLEEMTRIVESRARRGKEYFSTSEENVLRAISLYEHLNKQCETQELFKMTTDALNFLKKHRDINIKEGVIADDAS